MITHVWACCLIFVLDLLHDDNFIENYTFIPVLMTLVKVHGHSSIGKIKLKLFSYWPCSSYLTKTILCMTVTHLDMIMNIMRVLVHLLSFIPWQNRLTKTERKLDILYKWIFIDVFNITSNILHSLLFSFGVESILIHKMSSECHCSLCLLEKTLLCFIIVILL